MDTTTSYGFTPGDLPLPPPNRPSYEAVWLPAEKIRPSPENDDLYGIVENDEAMERLVDTIGRWGLVQPILLTADNYLLSGHRRFRATQILNWTYVPCRIRADVQWADNPRFHDVLAAFNTQRVKSVGSLLKEALLREKSPDDTYAA